ncbi:MAG: diadenylate cyclase [Phycisphaerae bacterium]|nr:diadenylate cyclase [Phycisphaerae bacterium]
MDNTLTSLLYRIQGDLPAVIIELVLIGLCVNWFAGILHSTRGTRPLRGVLVVLIVATVVVRLFGWERLELLYGYVLMGLAFIALVVFQPELRRALIRVGDNPFQRRRGPQSQLVTALVKSAGYLSRNRYGALIAVQRDVDLIGWAENGTMINAQVSANLLDSIFFPNSPLHDLGVIVRGSRVVAANCQFPSPDSDEIDAALGSRHLAAVGMSYESDALVLVVSEETGVISLADNGKLTRYLTLDDLTAELTKRLVREREPETAAAKPKRTFSTVWRRVRKVLVVVPLTLIIWYLVDQATFVDSSVEVELTIRHDDPGYIVDVLQPRANIVDLQDPRALVFFAEFNGPARAIDQLRGDAPPGRPLPVTWVLPDVYARSGEYLLAADDVRSVVEGLREIITRGLSVEQVTLKKQLRLSVDELVTIRVPVHVSDEPRPIEVEWIDPSAVEVRLRKRQQADLPPEPQLCLRAPLGENRLQGLVPEESKTFEGVVLEKQIGTVGVVRATPEQVTVAVRLVMGQRKRVENVVVRLLGDQEVFDRYRVEKVDPNEWRIDVEVQGMEMLLETLGPLDISAFVRLSSDRMPPVGGPPPESQLRSLPVITVLDPPRNGVSLVHERRVVRVNLVPKPGGTP